MPVYITAAHSLSPYGPSQHAALGPGGYRTPDPAYAEIICAAELRRLPRLTRQGLYASARCLAQAGLRSVDAIVVGSGLGSFEGFDKFETALVRQEEQGLPPTAFIQSLDNAVMGHLALRYQCQGYNMTYTHRGFSFESALLDGLLLLTEPGTELTHVLVGGLDENTPTYAALLAAAGHVKAVPEDVAHGSQPGVVPGEGATFLVLAAERTAGALATLHGLQLLVAPHSAAEVQRALLALLAQHHLAPADLDLVLLGHCGDPTADHKLRAVEAALFAGHRREYFKNHCGEYPTAAAYGVWLATQHLAGLAGPEPGAPLAPDAGSPGPPATSQPRTCLVVNHYRDQQYSFILLTNA